MSKIHAISQEILVNHIAPAGSTQENNALNQPLLISLSSQTKPCGCLPHYYKETNAAITSGIA